MRRNSPGHDGWYVAANKKFEALDVVQQFELGYEKGNALEYLLRAGKKTRRAGKEGSRESHILLTGTHQHY